MNAIIISDKDAMSLLEQLELQKWRASHVTRQDPSNPATADDMHRWFHYVVTRWLQEQGARCVR